MFWEMFVLCLHNGSISYPTRHQGDPNQRACWNWLLSTVWLHFSSPYKTSSFQSCLVPLSLSWSLQTLACDVFVISGLFCSRPFSQCREARKTCLRNPRILLSVSLLWLPVCFFFVVAEIRTLLCLHQCEQSETLKIPLKFCELQYNKLILLLDSIV